MTYLYTILVAAPNLLLFVAAVFGIGVLVGDLLPKAPQDE